MHEPSYTSIVGTERFPAISVSYPVHISEIEAEKAAFRAWLRLQKLKRDLLWVASFWPIAGGVILGLMAPTLNDVLSHSIPWLRWVLFPFAVLAEHPGLPAGWHLAASAPFLILLAQFPVEGLFARMVLRRRSVTVHGVTGQVFYMHYLGILQLLMVSGVVSQVLQFLGIVSKS